MRDWLDALWRGDLRLIAATLALGSMLLYIAAANAVWDFARTGEENGWTARLRNATSSTTHLALYELLRFFYYLGIPYFALYFGLVDLRSMGLGYFDWGDSLRSAILLLVGAWCLLMVGWVRYLRASSSLPVTIQSESVSAARRIVNAVYLQAHWAFYRAVCIMLFATSFREDAAVLLGSMAGVALVAIEALACAPVRRALRVESEAEVVIWNGLQGLINAVGFVLTRNVWLLALVHLSLEFSVPHLRDSRSPSSPKGSRSFSSPVDTR